MIEQELTSYLQKSHSSIAYDEALATALDAGTSEGVRKAWEKRHRKSLSEHFKKKGNAWQINLAKSFNGMTPAELKQALKDMWFEDGIDPKEGESFPEVSIEEREKGVKRFSSENGTISPSDYSHGQKVFCPEYGEGFVDEVVGPDGGQAVLATFKGHGGKLFKFGTNASQFTLPLSKLKKV